MSTPIYDQLAQERGSPFADSATFKFLRVQLSTLRLTRWCVALMQGNAQHRDKWKELERCLEVVDSAFFRCLAKWDWRHDRQMHQAVRAWIDGQSGRSIAKILAESNVNTALRLYTTLPNPSAYTLSHLPAYRQGPRALPFKITGLTS